MEKRQGAVTRFHVAHAGQRRGDVRLASRRALQHEQAIGGKARRGGLERWADRMEIVRWIQQDQIERSARISQRRENVTSAHIIARRDAAGGQIGLDQRDRARVSLDERDVSGAAAEGLDADCSGAGKTVEHASLPDARCQDVEQGLTELVGSWAKTLPGRRLEAAPLVAPGDHPHRLTTKVTKVTKVTKRKITGFPSCSS